jgi:hypothetical protein
MTLNGVLNKARALEAAATQANKMERETDQTALATTIQLENIQIGGAHRVNTTRSTSRNNQQTDEAVLSVAVSSINDYQRARPDFTSATTA